MRTKVVNSAVEALALAKARGVLKDGATVMVGGFGLCGIPEHLIVALRDSGVKRLTCISNNAGVDDFGLGLLLKTRQIAKMISSYVGENAEFERQFLSKELEIEFNPQGTLAERIRAGGAGIPAFYTATGAGTVIADDKETRAMLRPSEGIGGATIPGRGFGGRSGTAPQSGQPRDYVLETGLYADVALVKAWKADAFGNLVYRMTARNFNPMMATAASVVLAEVEEVVEVGTLDPDTVHTPGNYVDAVVKTTPEKRIEQKTVRK
ncbi:MAG: CoA transferase subunit A [Planctomycetes bacterium]|nr:CoA transferase subunit A [Planctomycetota bacterium]